MSHCRFNMDGRGTALIFTTALMIATTRMMMVTAASTSPPTSSTTVPLIVRTTRDPVRCNGEPPPPGRPAQLEVLAPGVLTYTCIPGTVQTGSGNAVIRCDVNATSWFPPKGLVCERSKLKPVGEFREGIILLNVHGGEVA